MRGVNARFVGDPDRVVVATRTEHVVAAVQRAVDAGSRISVRSGGHCYENFVFRPEIDTVIDLSRMDGVYFDQERGAFAVRPGATLGRIYETLFHGWAVTLPGGSCTGVGAGGHFAGGGYGPLSRRFGLTVDHLEAVEVVLVDRSGTAKAIVATRDPDDPHHHLWWAHTGGGGGNFGIVTAYWFRSPGVGPDAAADDMLPTPPKEMLVNTVTFDWSSLSAETFHDLIDNYGAWCERHSSPDDPYASLFAQLQLAPAAAGSFTLTTQLEAGGHAPGLLDDFLASVADGVPYVETDRRVLPWMHTTTGWPGFSGGDRTTRFKAKSAYHRTSFTPVQTEALYRGLVQYGYPGALVMLSTFGGMVNSVEEAATASAHRDSVLKPHYVAFWTDPEQDAEQLERIRTLYSDVYADTGGVPVPDEHTDGCFINYADSDMANPELNTSGVRWTTLYYKDNYPRLRRIKHAYDPHDVFGHALAVES
ncbi:FAD-binding oxidoreductase [Saccharomonospora saliphila]|uniref:FAD-binding oxidoreductase n=1 Tax=Saccharomonospora saliphila TaxID=369829 RepID=UPI00036E1D52|nr:FAD-binding oxidoreductase [Saccharomonospora saliphila]